MFKLPPSILAMTTPTRGDIARSRMRHWIVNPHRAAKSGGAVARRRWKRARAAGRA